MDEYNFEKLCSSLNFPPSIFAQCDKRVNCITARDLAKLDENDGTDIDSLKIYGVPYIYTKALILESKAIMRQGKICFEKSFFLYLT